MRLNTLQSIHVRLTFDKNLSECILLTVQVLELGSRWGIRVNGLSLIDLF